MPIFRVYEIQRVRVVREVEADTPEAARLAFDDGEGVAVHPDGDVIASEFVSVTEVEGD